MRFQVCVVAAAALLLADSKLRGQAAPPAGADSVTRTVEGGRTTIRFPAANRPPSWGFAFRMNPGPNLEYTHPFVTQVVKGSAAEQAGLLQGDTIIAVDGRDTRHPPMFSDPAPGVRHLLRIRRAGEEMELTFVMPAPAT
jgi:S1-C subfamily serine protease